MRDQADVADMQLAAPQRQDAGARHLLWSVVGVSWIPLTRPSPGVSTAPSAKQVILGNLSAWKSARLILQLESYILHKH